MKRMLRRFLVIASGSSLLTGCIYSHRAVVVREPATVTYPSSTVVVTEEPPPPRREVLTTAPDEQHVWVAGYWAYTNHRWVWMPGHWELRPRPNAVWVPGRWDKNPTERGWIWTPGHWE